MYYLRKMYRKNRLDKEFTLTYKQLYHDLQKHTHTHTHTQNHTRTRIHTNTRTSELGWVADMTSKESTGRNRTICTKTHDDDEDDSNALSWM